MPQAYSQQSFQQPPLLPHHLNASTLETLIAILTANMYAHQPPNDSKESELVESLKYLNQKIPNTSNSFSEQLSSIQNLTEMPLQTNVENPFFSTSGQSNPLAIEQINEMMNENFAPTSHLLSRQDHQPMASNIMKTFAKNQTSTAAPFNTDLLMQRFSDMFSIEIKRLLQQVSLNNTNERSVDVSLTSVNSTRPINSSFLTNSSTVFSSASFSTAMANVSATDMSAIPSRISTNLSLPFLANGGNQSAVTISPSFIFSNVPAKNDRFTKEPKMNVKSELKLSHRNWHSKNSTNKKRHSYIPDHIYTTESVNGVRKVIQKPFTNNLLNQIEFKKRFTPYNDSKKLLPSN